MTRQIDNYDDPWVQLVCIAMGREIWNETIEDFEEFVVGGVTVKAVARYDLDRFMAVQFAFDWWQQQLIPEDVRRSIARMMKAGREAGMNVNLSMEFL